jgi:hypothetical protein
VRDQARIRQLAKQWRAMEQAHSDPDWSHAFRRHVDITDQQVADRAAAWGRAKGYRDDVPDNATKWRSSDAMIIAADGLERSDEFSRKLALAEANKEDQFELDRPLSEVLGRGWRADVYGRTTASYGVQASRWNDDSFVVGCWRRQSDGRWYPLTCYPHPGD